MSFSPPIDFSAALSRRAVKQAFFEVRKAGARAPGRDGREYPDVFGSGPRSRTYQQSLNQLQRRRHAYRLIPARRATIYDEVTGKKRTIHNPAVVEKVLYRALTKLMQEVIPPSRLVVNRSSWDARWSVSRLALELSWHSRVAFRSDLRSAFPSLLWEKALNSESGRRLPKSVRKVLTQILSFHSPSGRGSPIGFAFSPIMLDIACAVLDQRLLDLGVMVYRYMDDLVSLSPNPAVFERIRELVVEELGKYGLQEHPGKTDDYRRRDGWEIGHWQPQKQLSFPWLGHEIDLDGAVDVTEEVSKRILVKCKSGQHFRQWKLHFRLAKDGSRFRETVRTWKQMTEEKKAV